MTIYENKELYKSGFINQLASAGVDRDVVEFAVKNAEYDALGDLSPEDFCEGFANAVYEHRREKRANDFESSIGAMLNKKDKEDDESLLDKIKKWAKYTAIGGGGFLLGKYYKNMRNYTRDAFDRVDRSYQVLSDKKQDSQKSVK